MDFGAGVVGAGVVGAGVVSAGVVGAGVVGAGVVGAGATATDSASSVRRVASRSERSRSSFDTFVRFRKGVEDKVMPGRRRMGLIFVVSTPLRSSPLPSLLSSSS